MTTQTATLLTLLDDRICEAADAFTEYRDACEHDTEPVLNELGDVLSSAIGAAFMTLRAALMTTDSTDADAVAELWRLESVMTQMLSVMDGTASVVTYFSGGLITTGLRATPPPAAP